MKTNDKSKVTKAFFSLAGVIVSSNWTGSHMEERERKKSTEKKQTHLHNFFIFVWIIPCDGSVSITLVIIYWNCYLLNQLYGYQ